MLRSTIIFATNWVVWWTSCSWTFGSYLGQKERLNLWSEGQKELLVSDLGQKELLDLWVVPWSEGVAGPLGRTLVRNDHKKNFFYFQQMIFAIVFMVV